MVKHYLKYTVLIIDEIGYLPVDEAAAFGFFQLIAARYEYRPTILTTNQPFSKWPDVFGDAVIANAIIDRLVHHCDIVKITGHSYRIKGENIFDNTDDYSFPKLYILNERFLTFSLDIYIHVKIVANIFIVCYTILIRVHSAT